MWAAISCKYFFCVLTFCCRVLFNASVADGIIMYPMYPTIRVHYVPNVPYQQPSHWVPLIKNQTRIELTNYLRRDEWTGCSIQAMALNSARSVVNESHSFTILPPILTLTPSLAPQRSGSELGTGHVGGIRAS